MKKRHLLYLCIGLLLLLTSCMVQDERNAENASSSAAASDASKTESDSPDSSSNIHIPDASASESAQESIKPEDSQSAPDIPLHIAAQLVSEDGAFFKTWGGSRAGHNFVSITTLEGTPIIDMIDGTCTQVVPPEGFRFLSVVETGYVFLGEETILWTDRALAEMSRAAIPLELQEELEKRSQELIIKVSFDGANLLFSKQAGDSAAPRTDGVFLYSFATEECRQAFPAGRFYTRVEFMRDRTLLAVYNGESGERRYITFDMDSDAWIELGSDTELGSIINIDFPYIQFEHALYDASDKKWVDVTMPQQNIVSNGSVFYFGEGRLMLQDIDSGAVLETDYTLPENTIHVAWLASYRHHLLVLLESAESSRLYILKVEGEKASA